MGNFLPYFLLTIRYGNGEGEHDEDDEMRRAMEASKRQLEIDEQNRSSVRKAPEMSQE